MQNTNLAGPESPTPDLATIIYRDQFYKEHETNTKWV